MQFHSLSLSQVRRISNSAIEVTFDVPDNLKPSYEFSHGQFVSLRAEINGELVERSYSICSAPYERVLKVAIKQIDKGVFSTWANTELKEGDKLAVSLPMGSFTSVLDSSQKRQYLLVAAGSGITPIISILKMTLASETQASTLLVYANSSPATTMFSEELLALQKRYADRLTIKHVYSQSAEGDAEGRLDEALLDELVASAGFDYQQFDQSFICGPELLTLSLRESLLENKSMTNVNIELFTPASSSTNNSEACDLNNEEQSGADIVLTIDGEDIHFKHQDSTQTILETALDYDPDLPYGCQNGSCGACQATVVSGKVEMAVNYALSESEVEDGCVLVCQAKPLTLKVHISYDD